MCGSTAMLRLARLLAQDEARRPSPRVSLPGRPAATGIPARAPPAVERVHCEPHGHNGESVFAATDQKRAIATRPTGSSSFWK